MSRRAVLLSVVVVVLAGSLVQGARPVDAGASEGRAGTVRGAESTIVAGSYHTCALLASQQVKCWGFNDAGQLGQGNTINLGDSLPSEMGDNLAPVALGSGRTAAEITVGRSHTCALLDNGQVKCWGLNDAGQLGQGNTINLGDGAGEMGDNLVPVALGSGRTATAIAAGWDFSCALLDNGQVKCWGNNIYGQLGQGNQVRSGDNQNEMGDNLTQVSLGSGRTATAITAGDGYTCALLDNGQVKCWGSNNYGQLGQGNLDYLGDDPGEMGDNLVPVSLGSGRTAAAIDAGGAHTCAVLDNGQVKCLGSNNTGELGVGNTNKQGDGPGEMGDNLAPIALGSGRTAKAITGAFAHTCALLDNGQVKCWGYNFWGQLGLDTFISRGDSPGTMGDNLPAVNLGVGRTAYAVTVGGGDTCALLDNGRVKCWGLNDRGQLGQDNTSNLGDAPGEMANLAPINLGNGLLVVPVVVTPAPPVGVAAVAGVLSASVSWSAPADTGGAAVTGYRVESSVDAGVHWATAVSNTNSTGTSQDITGLTAGQTVVFRVSAINGQGVGVPSAPSAVVTPWDVVGYTSLDPARLLDTRIDGSTIDGSFHTGVKVAAGGEVALQVTGRGGVPGNASAAVLNVTVTDPEAAGFVTVYPCGTPRPNASNLNYVTGSTVPNNVIVKVGAGGTVCLFSLQATNLIADINGAFT